MTTTTTMATTTTTAMSEADTIILPPPTALNPLPSLPAALRLDNRDQLLGLLEGRIGVGSSSVGIGASGTAAATTTSSRRRQLLVFEDDALRQLLLRQVLNDPHSSSSNNPAQQQASQQQRPNSKKNWQTYNKFNYPKSLEGTIVGTRLLELTRPRNGRNKYGPNNTTTSSTSTKPNSTTTTNPFDHDDTPTTNGNGSDPELLTGDTLNLGQHVDIVTYFVRPWKLDTTLGLVQKIPKWKSSLKHNGNNPIQHQVVYLPNINAFIQQIWDDSNLNTHATMMSLQLDIFPLESDVWSLEHPHVIRELLEGTPSNSISTCARTLLKIQDLTGIFPRIQALGPMAEDILQKTLYMAVDEYVQKDQEDDTDMDENYDTTNQGTYTNSGVEPIKANKKAGHMACILLDRQVDMVTPLATPLTYEGLLDEVVGIETGFLQVPQSYLNPEEEGTSSSPAAATSSSSPNTTIAIQAQQQQQQQRVALGVHAGDSLYAEVRDQHVEQFGTFLQNQAKALQESHANFTNKQQRKDLNQIHQFVKQIPMFTQNLRTLTNHIHLAESIQAFTQAPTFREQWQTERSLLEGETAYDTLEEWIGSHHPIEKVLRGLCLQSLCSGGLKGHKYDQLRQLIVQGYGYEYALKLHALEQLGWIRRRDTFFEAATFGNLRKSLILIHPEVNTMDPDDVSYVSSGYAPLSVRLIQASIQGWTKSRAEIWKDLPGRCIDVEPTWPPQELSTLLSTSSTNPTKPSLGEIAKAATTTATTTTTNQQQQRKPVLIVFFVGGISYMEIAALRFLSKRPSFPYHIIMLTTKIINGNTLLQQTLEDA